MAEDYNSDRPRYDSNRGGYSRGYNNRNNYNNGEQRNSNYRSFSDKGDAPRYNNSNNRGFQRKSQEPYSNYKPYVIASNQNVPPEIVEQFKEIIHKLNAYGFTLRYSSMRGTIDDHISGLADKEELYLPWKNFGDKDSPFNYNHLLSIEAAREHQPGYDDLPNDKVKAFLAKNARMMFGNKDLKSPALFFITWTECGSTIRHSKMGNMANPTSLANSRFIPVFNLQNPSDKERLYKLIESNLDNAKETKPSSNDSIRKSYNDDF